MARPIKRLQADTRWTPAHTFSDMEVAVQRRIGKSGVVDWQDRAARSETEATERALLKKLQQKYETRSAAHDVPTVDGAPYVAARQADLFG